MTSPYLILRIGFGLLRSRPTLAVLAVLLLALSSAMISGLSGTAYLLRSVERGLMESLEMELELVDESEATRAGVLSRLQKWPGVQRVRYVSPEEILTEIEATTGEKLRDLFGTNPFPGVMRVRISSTERDQLDSRAAEARNWPQVSAVAYPRNLWQDLERLQRTVRRYSLRIALATALTALLLTGLCFRAQIRSRADEWRLLQHFGMSRRALIVSQVVQAGVTGVIGGALANVLVASVASVYQYLLLTSEVRFPTNTYLQASAVALGIALAAGLGASLPLELRRRRGVLSKGE